ncbi:uncharacterized protein [Ptychodera flava]|uniref:uncharacterized protein n=1 Tax=Ptychodera flava TaxID=63121 RepID=UPI003969C564
MERSTNLDVHTIQVTWTLPNATDNSGVVSLTGSHEPGCNFTIGVTTVSYEAEDSSGNTARCSFSVTVKAVARPFFDVLNGTQKNISISQVTKRFGELCDAISWLANASLSAQESKDVAQDILVSVNTAIVVLLDVNGENGTRHQDRSLLTRSVFNATDKLATFVLSNIEPGSGQVILETPSIHLNLESDFANKLTNQSIIMADGSGFIIPPKKQLFPNGTSDGNMNRIIQWLDGRLFRHVNKGDASDVLSLTFTDREGNTIEVNDTREDISIIFANDGPSPSDCVDIEGICLDDNVIYFGFILM